MKRVDVDISTKLLIVQFKFRHSDRKEAMKTLNHVLTLHHKTFSRGFNAYLVPPSAENIKKLHDWDFSFPDDFAELAGHSIAVKKVAKLPYHNIKVPKYLHFLRPYQKEAFQFLKYREGRGLIADDMGIGKTFEALGWIRDTLKHGNALIIVPTSTKPQWLLHYREIIDEDVEVLYGQTSHVLRDCTYIINWDIVLYWEKELLKVPFYTVVADECQMMGNKKSQRTKTVKKLAKKADSFIPMSGTPIDSKPRQFFPVLNLLDKEIFPDEWKYINRYCGKKHNGFGFTYDGVSHVEELHYKVSKLMIRRHKREVLKDLPPLDKSVVQMALGKSITKYKALESNFFDTYETHSMSKKDMENEVYNLKMEIFDMKFKSICLWIEEFMTSGEKLIVGVWHHHVTDRLHTHFKGSSTKINGTVTGIHREKALSDFYNNIDVLFLQIKSGGVGLDGLQNVCCNAAIVELPPTPTLLDQFTSRLERSGQENPMNAYFLMGEGTLELDWVDRLDEVRENIDATMDGKETEDKDLLSMMFERSEK